MNLHPDAPSLHDWFFKAIDALVHLKVWRGRGGFVRQYGLNDGNFWKLQKHPEWDVPAQYLFWLVRDHGVSADWLLTGRGNILTNTPRPVKHNSATV